MTSLTPIRLSLKVVFGIDVSGAPSQDNGARLQLWECQPTRRNRDNASVTDQLTLTLQIQT